MSLSLSLFTCQRPELMSLGQNLTSHILMSFVLHLGFVNSGCWWEAKHQCEGKTKVCVRLCLPLSPIIAADVKCLQVCRAYVNEEYKNISRNFWTLQH